MPRRTRNKYESHVRFAPRFFVIVAVLAALLAAFLIDPLHLRKEPAGPEEPLPETGQNQDPPEPVVPKEDEKVTLSILCVGDVIGHMSQVYAADPDEDGVYDFTGPFRQVKPYIEAADLAICNVETTLAGEEPSGYPGFCTPDELADALIYAGFDVANTVNNHTIDKRTNGVTRTLEVLRSKGLQTVGTHLKEEKPYTLVEVKGVTVGIVSATYETATASSGAKTLNGIAMPADCVDLINTFRSTDYGFSEEAYLTDLARIGSEIAACREDGADLVVCYLHWGKEYAQTPNSAQTRMAQDVADLGADMIFASHPHVLQKAEYLVSASTGRDVPVFYSLGNFYSNQRTESLPDHAQWTEQGLMARVNVTYNITKGQVEYTEMDAVATWVDRWHAGTRSNGNTRYDYAIIPLDHNLELNNTLKGSGHMERAKSALSDIRNIVGADYIY